MFDFNHNYLRKMEQASPLFGNLMTKRVSSSPISRGVATPDYAFQSAHVKKMTIAR